MKKVYAIRSSLQFYNCTNQLLALAAVPLLSKGVAFRATLNFWALETWKLQSPYLREFVFKCKYGLVFDLHMFTAYMFLPDTSLYFTTSVPHVAEDGPAMGSQNGPKAGKTWLQMRTSWQLGNVEPIKVQNGSNLRLWPVTAKRLK